MIVRLFDLRNATVCHKCDPGVPVIAKRVPDQFGYEWIEVKGHQIKVALINDNDKLLYRDEASYYLYNFPDIGRVEWEEVVHDHISFNSAVKDYVPDADTTYIFRVQGLNHLGFPKVLVSDALKARLITRKQAANFRAWGDTIELKPTCVRYHKPIHNRRA